jgi:hypothetical protein
MKLFKLFSHRVLGLIISILMFASFAFAAESDIDVAFVPNLKISYDISNSNVYAIQPDNKLIVSIISVRL